MRAYLPLRFWIPTFIGVGVGLVFFTLSFFLLADDGLLLTIFRRLHDPATLLAGELCYYIGVPPEWVGAYLFVPKLAVFAQWSLLGLLIGWACKKFCHEKRTA